MQGSHSVDETYFYRTNNYRYIITLPAEAVAKYCDESVCVYVCLSVREDISGTIRAVFTKFLCMLPMAVARSSSSR